MSDSSSVRGKGPTPPPKHVELTQEEARGMIFGAEEIAAIGKKADELGERVARFTKHPKTRMQRVTAWLRERGDAIQEKAKSLFPKRSWKGPNVQPQTEMQSPPPVQAKKRPSSKAKPGLVSEAETIKASAKKHRKLVEEYVARQPHSPPLRRRASSGAKTQGAVKIKVKTPSVFQRFSAWIRGTSSNPHRTSNE